MTIEECIVGQRVLHAFGGGDAMAIKEIKKEAGLVTCEWKAGEVLKQRDFKPEVLNLFKRGKPVIGR